MATQFSPLHVFDNQIWEELLRYLTAKSFCHLILTGDKRVSAGCICGIRSFRMSCETVECFILSRALVTNLKSLTIELPWNDASCKKNCPIVLEMISSGCLTELTLTGFNNTGMQLTLPPTLKKFAIMEVGDRALITLSLGEARLSYLCVQLSRPPAASQSYCQRLIDTLVLPSAETLEHLEFQVTKPVALNLSKHLVLSFVSFNICCLLSSVPFVASPATNVLVLKSHDRIATKVQNVISKFGPSLTDVRISFIDLQTLDISQCDYIESLTVPHYTNLSLTCAPNKHLRIVCTDQPKCVINNGPGTITIACSRMILYGGHIPPGVTRHVDWSTIKSVVLNYATDYTVAQNVDYSPIQQAVNLTKLGIRNDTLESFASRNLGHFLQFIAKLAVFEWDMNAEICPIIATLNVVLPTSVTRLRIEIRGRLVVSDSELVHLLDWMRHVPSTLELVRFPFIPKIVSLCNDATSKFHLEYVSDTSTSWPSIWSDDMPTFVPSPHLSCATFKFIHGGSNHTIVKTIHKVFGSLCPKPGNSPAVILYRSDLHPYPTTAK